MIETKITDAIIKTQNLKKYFGAIKAVDGVDIQIQKGEIFGLLGPNGAGKSTLIRMLTSVLTPDEGNAIIQGKSIRTVQGKKAIRKLIGVCPQEVTIYEDLNAEENVMFVAQMHDISKEKAIPKVNAFLEKMGIAGRQDNTKNFSGGMQRRLNLVMALIHEPQVAFLDEPTAGLDPQARRVVWDYIRALKKTGMTVLLTTHDMVEADALSDHVAIIDHGKIIAEGTPEQLKEKFGSGNVIEIGFLKQDHLNSAKNKIESLENVTKVTAFGERKVLISFGGGLKTFVKILRQGIIENIEEEVESMYFRQNSLEDVFLHLTGRRLRE